MIVMWKSGLLGFAMIEKKKRKTWKTGRDEETYVALETVWTHG